MVRARRLASAVGLVGFELDFHGKHVRSSLKGTSRAGIWENRDRAELLYDLLSAVSTFLSGHNVTNSNNHKSISKKVH